MAGKYLLNQFFNGLRNSFQKFRRLSFWTLRDPMLAARVERLTTIPGVGLVTALTWALEIGEVSRFPSLKHAVSYCGLCSGENSSAGIQKRSPISKQRNKHLQTVLTEAAKLAPRWNSDLALLYEKEKQRGHRNRATLAVARKLVALPAGGRPPGKTISRRKEKGRAFVGSRGLISLTECRKHNRAACQALLKPGLGEPERAISKPSGEAPSVCFEAGRQTQTQSSVTALFELAAKKKNA